MNTLQKSPPQRITDLEENPELTQRSSSIVKTGSSFNGDKWFKYLTMSAGFVIIVALAAVAVFLIIQSLPAWFATPAEASILTGSFAEYVIPLIFGTIWVSFLALLIAVPVAVGIALYIVFYLRPKVAKTFSFLIDLLAAIPSVVFGLWGIMVLAPTIRPLFVWLEENLGWISLFSGTVSGTGRTTLTTAIVLAVMILPIITAICREVFQQTPHNLQEGALALGATKWEMITTAVMPYSRSGVISAIMLGLGRALGETMAVAMVLSATGVVSFRLLTSENPSTIAANIALSFPEAYGTNISVLIATGLILFAVTFIVNGVARAIIRR